MKSTEKIIELNKKQKEFYNTKKRNLATSIWSKIRHGLLANIRKELNISNQVYEKHKIWLGEISDKKILDLGCYTGNHLSIYMAEHAKEYIGLDLSDLAINKLNEKINRFPNAKGISADFLSEDDFPDKSFDIIYAYGVLHHFENTDILINKLKEKLSPKGIIISYDPLETSLPIKIIRTLYRPFQSDKNWEWPFTKKTFFKFESNFEIIERRGVLNKTKWFFLINFIPISWSKKIRIGKNWHIEDWEKSSNNTNYLFGCMHLTMLMGNK